MEIIEKRSKEKLSDEELIQRIKAGEIELYRIIMKRYNQRLYRTAVSFGISDFDCDDLIQQTHIKAFEKIEQFKWQAKFSTWLTRILINECLMFRRKKKSENRRFIDVEEDKPVTNPALQHQTPEREFMKGEMKYIIEKGISELPEKYRTVFVLREVEGMSVKECSETLEISEVNVKVRLLRARNILKDKLLKKFNMNEVLTFGNPRCDAIVERVMKHITDGSV